MPYIVNTVVGQIYLGDRLINKFGYLGNVNNINLKDGLRDGIIKISKEKKPAPEVQTSTINETLEELPVTLPSPLFKFIITFDSDQNILFGAGYSIIPETKKTTILYRMKNDNVIETILNYLTFSDKGMEIFETENNIFDILIGAN